MWRLTILSSFAQYSGSCHRSHELVCSGENAFFLKCHFSGILYRSSPLTLNIIGGTSWRGFLLILCSCLPVVFALLLPGVLFTQILQGASPSSLSPCVFHSRCCLPRDHSWTMLLESWCGPLPYVVVSPCSKISLFMYLLVYHNVFTSPSGDSIPLPDSGLCTPHAWTVAGM